MRIWAVSLSTQIRAKIRAKLRAKIRAKIRPLGKKSVQKFVPLERKSVSKFVHQIPVEIYVKFMRVVVASTMAAHLGKMFVLFGLSPCSLCVSSSALHVSLCLRQHLSMRWHRCKSSVCPFGKPSPKRFSVCVLVCIAWRYCKFSSRLSGEFRE